MKNLLLLLFLTVIIGTTVFAQSPESFKYQAVVRDASGEIIADQTVGLQIEIIESDQYGASVYVETHNPTTNEFGLINLIIGEGTIQTGVFEDIDWGNDNYFVKISIDITGGTSYAEMGTSQLYSVPYALHSKTTENYSETDPVFMAHDASGISGTDITNWNTAFGWGDHSAAGYLTTFTETDPVFGASPAGGILNTDVTNWNTAFGWGDHSSAGYITTFTETDPIFGASPAGGILNTDITNWNTAFGWGDHSAVGYLTSFSEIDPQVGTNTLYYIPRWDGTSLIAGTIYDTGTRIGISTTANTAKLNVSNSGTEDIINLFDGSTEVLTVEDGGNVGLGTTNPIYKLHVDNTASERGIYSNNHPTSGFSFGVYGAASGNSSSYGVCGWADGTITNYGIYGHAQGGTTNWAGYFTGDTKILGDIYMTEDDWIGIGASEEYIAFDGASNEISIMGAQLGVGTLGPVARLDVRNIGTEDILNLYDGTTEVLTVEDGGDIGIGITNPGYKLHVVDDYISIYSVATTTSTYAYGVYGRSNGATTVNRGVYGSSDNSAAYNYGIHGNTISSGTNRNYGVYGYASNSTASNYGVYGYALGTNNYAVYGNASSSTDNYAGYFYGNLHSTGTNTKSAGAVRIDHPLDPENKYLCLSSVESPDMMNIVNGNVILDSKGEAIVSMPDWFEAVNMEFRYQLTAIGAPGPNLYIKKKITNNQFVIAGGTSGMEVSWMVTGIRNDPFASEHRITVEEDKPINEKGKYIHPELYNQPIEKSVDYKNIIHNEKADK